MNMVAHLFSKLSQAIKSSVELHGRELSLQLNTLSQTFHDERFTREQERTGELLASSRLRQTNSVPR
jgi:hypothetical protein